MARAIWNGTVGFGLVQIPVGLYPAEAPDELDLTLLDKRDFSPIGYERVNKKTRKEVDWKDIVKGYEHTKGEYVILTDRDFEDVNIEASRQMDILAFVDFDSIDPRYIDRPYYLAPQKGGKKAYALLRETLRKTGKAGVGKVVIRSRQHLAAVVPHERALLLILLRFAKELREESELELPNRDLKSVGVTPKELTMAEKLVEGMVEKFEPEKYHDDYRDDLMKLIRRRAKAGETNSVVESTEKKPRRTEGAKVIDLAALLAESVSGAKHPRSKAKSAPRKKAARHEGHRKSA
jgi:DNA end-binding protein Ku